jgi:hypothetical protein
MKKFWIVALLLLMVCFVWLLYPQPDVDFSKDIKPIINKNCITCHGGVRRKAGFSLLFRQDALAPTESGKSAIVPGDPDRSEMIRRLTLNDPDERMPYKHEPLKNEQIDLLRRWIKEGAKWGDHWAYVSVNPPQEPRLIKKGEWAKNEIDVYVAAKWSALKLDHTP